MASVAPATDEELGNADGNKMSRVFGNARKLYRLAEALDDGLVIHSKSFCKDLKLVIKDRHVVVSCWTCHPKSSYSRNERTVVLMISLCFAYVFAGYAELFDQSGRTMLWISGIISQIVYDTYAKKLMQCACCKQAYACCQICGEALAYLVFAIFAVITLIMMATVCFWLLQASSSSSFGLSVVGFLWNKSLSWAFGTMFYLFGMYCLDRRYQMKPNKLMYADPSFWEEGKRSWRCFFTCGIFGNPEKPRCTKWNKWIGEDKWYDDLPEEPPDYEYEVKCRLCRTRYKYVPTGPYAYSLEDDVWDPVELKTAAEKRSGQPAPQRIGGK